MLKVPNNFNAHEWCEMPHHMFGLAMELGVMH